MAQLPRDLIQKIVVLGNEIRKKRQEGSLQSIIPPTIYGYLAFVRMAQALPHMELRQIALVTLLGNASLEDYPDVLSLCNQIFGLGKNSNPESVSESNNI